MRTYALVATALAVACSTGCGGGDGGGGGGGPQAVAASVTVSAGGTGALPSLGDTRALTAVVRDAGGATLPNATVNWSTSATSVVSLSGTSGAGVTAEAVANGSATITATSGTANGSMTIDVTQRLAAISTTPNPVSVSAGSTRQLTASARDARNNEIAGATGFAFSSNNDAVATVSSTGVVAGVANGAATVTVSLTRAGANASGTVPVTVAAAPMTATINLTAANVFNPAAVEIGAGGTVTYVFGALHNVTFLSAGSPDDIGDRSTGSVPRTFPSAGTFDFTCTLHAGMNGQVIVR